MGNRPCTAIKRHLISEKFLDDLSKLTSLSVSEQQTLQTGNCPPVYSCVRVTFCFVDQLYQVPGIHLAVQGTREGTRHTEAVAAINSGGGCVFVYSLYSRA